MASFYCFLDPYFHKYCSILLSFWPDVVSNETNSVFERSFKISNFKLNGRYPKFTAYFHLRAQCTTGKPKILLKSQSFHKTYTLRNVKLNRKSQVPEKSQNSCKIKQKKEFLGHKLDLNCPQWLCQRLIRNTDIVYKRIIPLHLLDAQFQFLCISCSRLYLEEALCFFFLFWT